MNVIQVIQNYIETIASLSKGMKIMLLDASTTPMMSMATTKSFLLSREIYLIEKVLRCIYGRILTNDSRLENSKRENVRHLTCICVIKPCFESVQHLSEELRSPKYGRYFVYFTNILNKNYLEILAASDDHEVVQSLQKEIFADYLAVHSDLAALYLPISTHNLWNKRWDTWDSIALQKSRDGLLSILLSLKKKPIIRYERNSNMAKVLGNEVKKMMEEEEQLFNFYRMDAAPILLILDRCNDPVTPLLTQWTYEAMVHELVGIEHGRVDISNMIYEKKLKEIILSPEQDAFFKENMYLNFGDLGTRIKEYVDHYHSKTKSNIEIQNVSDMKRFIEEYPEFRQLSGNVSKHVILMSELSTRVNKESLLEVSELEQSLACNDSHSTDLKNLQKLIQSPISNNNKIRLVLLYALRYEKNKNNTLSSLILSLAQAGVTPKELSIINTLLEYAGSSKRLDNLYELESIFSRARSGFKGLNDVENVYTQHRPRLQNILTSLIKGRLREQTHPCIEESTTLKEKPQDIIVYMVGGTTYTEARIVHEINLYIPGVRIILASDHIHNSKSFLQQLKRFNTTKINK